ncbi:hypothetical protein [Pseudoxanthomonas sp.]|uniref:hypothetical protein n=1 Tax=Pseudoxanthomonas sp. TaxID=1871049 RepID=UPI0025E665DF|nr:hypothetical protein [Pseudoxanthomonas sp.]
MTDLFALYVLFVLPALIFGLLPASFVLERVRFRLADALQLLAPYVVWMGLSAIRSGEKSLANLIELPILGAVTGLFFTARVALAIMRPHAGARAPQQALACSCLVAIAFWVFFPGLPE